MNQIPVLITPPRRPVVEQSPQSTTSLSDSQQCCGVVSKRKLFFMICTIIVIFILLNSWTGVLERKFDYMSLPVWIFLSKGIWSIVAAVTEPKIAYRHELCMLTRVKNAAYLFPQWIEFHILAGIDHFWIADDCSDDDGKTMFWLKFYADLGFVSIYKSPHVDCANHIPREWDLYNALFDRVQPKCKWTAVFDVDEYIFPTNEDEGKTAQGPYLKTLVKEARKPIFRMPSRFMSTHAREKRPPGLIIDAYVHDEFNPVIKTIIMSKYVALWNFSHYPHKLRREVPRIEGKTLKNYTYNSFARKEEYFPLPGIGNDCHLWKGEIYVKHYMMLSWDQFLSDRASRPYISDGSRNTYTQNGRNIWESSNISHPCPPVGEVHRKAMSARVMEAIEQRLAQYRSLEGARAHAGNHSVSKVPAALLPARPEDIKYLLSGEKLVSAAVATMAKGK